MTKLLVSVRSVEEAKVALEGNADLIDIKEPAFGSLGRASNSTIQEIFDIVAEKVPVSAAFGEWNDWSPPPVPEGLTYAKWGWSLLKRMPDYSTLKSFAKDADPVAVFYADFQKARSISIQELDLDLLQGYSVVLIDTYSKDGHTLLDYLDLDWLTLFRRNLSERGIALALAGSLNLEAIEKLCVVSPKWIAVRGAVCEGGRTGTISLAKVQEVKAILR